MSLLKEFREIKSTKKELREFAFVVGGVLIAIGAFRWWHHKSAHVELIAIGTALAMTGAIVPSVLKPLQKAWMFLALILGWIMTRVILTILFFLVLTPISLLARLTGKKFLDTRFREPGAQSYWTCRKDKNQTSDSYEKQF